MTRPGAGRGHRGGAPGPPDPPAAGVGTSGVALTSGLAAPARPRCRRRPGHRAGGKWGRRGVPGSPRPAGTPQSPAASATPSPPAADPGRVFRQRLPGRREILELDPLARRDRTGRRRLRDRVPRVDRAASEAPEPSSGCDPRWGLGGALPSHGTRALPPQDPRPRGSSGAARPPPPAGDSRRWQGPGSAPPGWKLGPEAAAHGHGLSHSPRGSGGPHRRLAAPPGGVGHRTPRSPAGSSCRRSCVGIACHRGGGVRDPPAAAAPSPQHCPPQLPPSVRHTPGPAGTSGCKIPTECFPHGTARHGTAPHGTGTPHHSPASPRPPHRGTALQGGSNVTPAGRRVPSPHRPFGDLAAPLSPAVTPQGPLRPRGVGGHSEEPPPPCRDRQGLQRPPTHPWLRMGGD